jgi:hypothetical protein
MYKYVSIDNLGIHLNLWEGRKEISVWSNQLSTFFAISHINDLIPILRELEEKYPDNFTPHAVWDNKKNEIFIAFYEVDKEGCEILCENIKTKPSLKSRFLNILKRL